MENLRAAPLTAKFFDAFNDLLSSTADKPAPEVAAA